MNQQYRSSVARQPIWASSLATVSLWAVVVVLAVVGVFLLPGYANLGGLLLVTALVLAAPAGAASQARMRA